MNKVNEREIDKKSKKMKDENLNKKIDDQTKKTSKKKQESDKKCNFSSQTVTMETTKRSDI